MNTSTNSTDVKDTWNVTEDNWLHQFENTTEIIRLLKYLGIAPGFESIRSTIKTGNRLAMNISTKDGNSDQSFVIYMDIIDGAPTIQQFVDVVYDGGSEADLRILICRTAYDGSDEPPSNYLLCLSLTEMINKSGSATYFVRAEKSSECNSWFNYEIEVHPKSNRFSIKENMPSRRQVLEGEFWALYYEPLWGAEPIYDADVMIGEWLPSYNLNHLITEALWKDEGLLFSVSGDYLRIRWLWNHKDNYFEKEYHGCPITFDQESNKITVKYLDMTMSKLIELTPAEKWKYANMVYGQEHIFIHIIEDAMYDFDEGMRQELSPL
jgi:hypothetical protein